MTKTKTKQSAVKVAKKTPRAKVARNLPRVVAASAPPPPPPSRAVVPAVAPSSPRAPRIVSTGLESLDRVLNGGLALGQTLLVTSPRGAGKTTIFLQVCDAFKHQALFASGEMTEEAMREYAERLGAEDVHFYCDPQGLDVEEAFTRARDVKAKLLVIDSVQASVVNDVKGDIGHPAMMNAVTNMVTSFAQKTGVAVVLFSHMTKDGECAGTEMMLHLADGILRLDTLHAPDGRGGREDVGLRQVSIDDKLRWGPAGRRAVTFLTERGFVDPTSSAPRRLR